MDLKMFSLGLVFVALMASVVTFASVPAQAAAFNVTTTELYSSSGFTVGNLLQTPDRIYPGDEVQLRFFLQATSTGGGQEVQLHILAPFKSTQSAFGLGNMNPGDSKAVIFDYTVSEDTKPGSYYIFLYIVTSDGGQAEVGEIPLTVNEPLLSNALVASVPSLPDAYAGDSVDVPVQIRNVGALPAEDVVVQMQFSSSNALIPVGSDRAYITSIDANGTAVADFKVGINAGANPGYYPITLLVSYKVDKVLQTTINQTIGLKTLAKTELLVTADTITSGTQPYLSIAVANTGDTAVRGVTVSVSSNDFTFTGGSEKFIGTLNLDDSATASVNLVARTAGGSGAGFGNASSGRNASGAGGFGGAGSAGTGAGQVTVKTTYKDSLNVEHTQEQIVQVRLNSDASGASSASGTVSSRRTQAFTVLGLQPLEWAVVILVVLAGFFGYKWYKKRGNGSKNASNAQKK